MHQPTTGTEPATTEEFPETRDLLEDILNAVYTSAPGTHDVSPDPATEAGDITQGTARQAGHVIPHPMAEARDITTNPTTKASDATQQMTRPPSDVSTYATEEPTEVGEVKSTPTITAAASTTSTAGTATPAIHPWREDPLPPMDDGKHSLVEGALYQATRLEDTAQQVTQQPTPELPSPAEYASHHAARSKETADLADATTQQTAQWTRQLQQPGRSFIQVLGCRCDTRLSP